MSVSSEITSLQTQTSQYQASQTKNLGSTQKYDKDMFLQLMMKELEYQDPLEPMDNTEFIAQQAQFTQVETLENISSSLETNNSIMQTLSLVGKQVTLVDPDNSSNKITGLVDSADFSSTTASISVNGKSYPISNIVSVSQPSTTTTE